MNSWEMDIYLLPPCCLCLPSPSAMEELGFPRFFSFPLLIMFTLSHCCCVSQCYSDSQYLKCFKSNMLGASESSFCRYRVVRKSWSFVLFKWVEVVGGKLWERLGFSFQWLKAAVQCQGALPKTEKILSGSLGWWHIVSSSRNPSTALACLSFCSLALCSLIYYKIFHLHCEMSYSKNWWKFNPTIISGQRNVSKNHKS